MPLVRLDKLLSGQGIGTRSEARKMVSGRFVEVNGVPVNRADIKVDPLRDKISVRGREVRFREHIYIMMNKPKGVVSASRDPRERTVIDLLEHEMQRPGLFPAGRLDKDTEGLMIITDDGVFAHEILAPKKHVDKKYYAKINGRVEPEEAAIFHRGIELEDGTRCMPAELEVIRTDELSEVYVVLHEGRYHQIKRMFEALGKSVAELKRLSIGGVDLDPELGPGMARELTSEELCAVKFNKTTN